LQYRRRIRRTFAIAATPVTQEQFLLQVPGFYIDRRYCPDPSCPVGGVTWYDAAAYCNWLSKQEGLPEEQWCYETDTNGQVTKLKENYLSRTGYRLPTEAEWEYACRAGALTSRYYGEAADLLRQYAWYGQNSNERTWPVGSKKPNDLGLFDMHGNLWTWCQESYKSSPGNQDGSLSEETEEVLTIDSKAERVIRGGSFLIPPRQLRSASRSGVLPSQHPDVVGFRLARTFTP
jgi:formylglycine-generating enzyme required for sulfatase activity